MDGTILREYDLESQLEEMSLTGLKKHFAPDYMGFTEELMSNTEVETNSDRTGCSATTAELFPPARFLSRSQVEKFYEEEAAKKEKKQRKEKDYVDLTGDEPNMEEVEKIRQLLKQLMLPNEASLKSKKGKKNCVEGEVNVDPL